MKEKNQQKIIRQLSSCLIEKYNGFTVVSIDYKKNKKQKIKAIDIIYKPTKHVEIEPLFSLAMIFQKHIHLFTLK